MDIQLSERELYEMCKTIAESKQYLNEITDDIIKYESEYKNGIIFYEKLYCKMGYIIKNYYDGKIKNMKEYLYDIEKNIEWTKDGNPFSIVFIYNLYEYKLQWYDNGNLNMMVIIEKNQKLYIENKIVKEWHENGKKWKYYNYLNGKPCRGCKEWDTNGKLIFFKRFERIKYEDLELDFYLNIHHNYKKAGSIIDYNGACYYLFDFKLPDKLILPKKVLEFLDFFYEYRTYSYEFAETYFNCLENAEFCFKKYNTDKGSMMDYVPIFMRYSKVVLLNCNPESKFYGKTLVSDGYHEFMEDLRLCYYDNGKSYEEEIMSMI